MRVTLRQTFPFGRFHATPWKVFPFDDPHGEWPPSPWRLLRGLLARSFQYRREGGEVSDEQQGALVTAFAGSRIAWHLPPASWRGPGLRQYQPAEFKRVPASAKEPGMMGYNTTKVMDAFLAHGTRRVRRNYLGVVVVSRGRRMDEETLALLDACAARLTYFGRAESITELERITETLTKFPTQTARSKPAANKEPCPSLASPPQRLSPTLFARRMTPNSPNAMSRPERAGLTPSVPSVRPSAPRRA